MQLFCQFCHGMAVFYISVALASIMGLFYSMVHATVNVLLFLRNCNLPLCHVIVSVGDYLLNNVRGSPWPFVGSLYNRYCL